ncbi:neuropeptide FF receptor 2-like [Dendronephthya gigantea]|uniref:neuropeptide FF receptor 2-like n=1 Tax=Dendronephthya gigantea TaxID=151771 RepID=UPI0010699CFA|nr:neuropeptide FF receptor 2-like [Dendronephthya gigantea]XP_028403593.1 neuropeptide FF receptor 2-like [Dendronephthya gigantea]
MGVNSTSNMEEPFALTMVLRLFYVIVFCIGLFGNLFVCVVVIQQRRMRTVMNCFTLNLAISDLIIIVIYVPSQYAAYENNQNWPFGNVGCRITYSIVPVCLTASIATLLAISCERFRGIVFPFQPRMRLTTVRRIIIIIWAVSIATALPLMIIAGTIIKDNNIFCDEIWPNGDSSRYYWIAMFLLQYVIPLFIMSVLYSVAGWKLQKRSRFLSKNSRGRSGSVNYAAEIARQRQSQKITKMLVALIFIYSFCMLPQHIVYFWTQYGDLGDWKYFLYVFRISNVFTMANSALNSIVYGTLQTEFRKAYRLFFLKCNCCLCLEKGRDDSSQGKPYNKIAFKLKDVQKDTEKTLLGQRMRSLATALPQTDSNGTSGANKTTLRRRLSSDSRSPLISGDSTSDSQPSKHSEYHTEGEKKIMLQQNGVKVKELKNWNEDVKDFHEHMNAGTTYVKVFLNRENQRKQGLVQDERQIYVDTNIKLEDICSLDNVRETVL